MYTACDSPAGGAVTEEHFMFSQLCKNDNANLILAWSGQPTDSESTILPAKGRSKNNVSLDELIL